MPESLGLALVHHDQRGSFRPGCT